MIPAPAKPLWNPKDKAAPLKEEYLLFYQETMQYHDRTKGYLGQYPDLHAQLPDLPAPLDVFTDKCLILASTSDLRAHIGELHALRLEGKTQEASRESSIEPTPKTTSPRLKVALPTAFDGTTAKSRTFLAECRTFMKLNESSFSSDHVRILWALQLCSDKTANWKRIQLETMEGTGHVPEYLRRWDDFQKEFLLKWSDLYAQKKARAKFAAGIKQTTSVRRYAELFEDLVLEADYHDPVMLAATFYEGLKWEVRCDLVGRTPNTLADLKALAIILDEERTGTNRRDSRSNATRASTKEMSETTRSTTSQMKAEARVGTSLSADERARYMREGRCFGCGKPGHRRPECPDGKPRVHVSVTEPVVSPSIPESLPIHRSSDVLDNPCGWGASAKNYCKCDNYQTGCTIAPRRSLMERLTL